MVQRFKGSYSVVLFVGIKTKRPAPRGMMWVAMEEASGVRSAIQLKIVYSKVVDKSNKARRQEGTKAQKDRDQEFGIRDRKKSRHEGDMVPGQCGTGTS